MTHCPICNATEAICRDSSGDFKQFDCPQCGHYQITGTALAMLTSRLSVDEVTIGARMSHAIRTLSDSNTTDARFEITSLNVDELTKKTLPSIDKQQTNFLNWLIKNLGEDQLGTVKLPPEKILASIVGAINGDRANKLVSLMEAEGLVARCADSGAMVTSKGWQMLEPAPQVLTIAPKEVANMKVPEDTKIVMAHCNKCKGDRRTFVRATHTVEGNDGEISWGDTYDILECCGCQTISVRHERWFSEWDQIVHDLNGKTIMVPGVQTKYWPPPIRRTKPDWSSEITDAVLRGLFDELYAALDSNLLVLSTIGARTLFDRASYLQVSDPPGGFSGKLDAMVMGQFISSSEKGILEAMTDAGNASAHRGYSPTFEQLSAIVDILENYLHRSIVLVGVAVALKESTPPRTPKKM